MGYVRVVVYTDGFLWDYFFVSFEDVIHSDSSRYTIHRNIGDGDCDENGFEIVNVNDTAYNPDGDKQTRKRRQKFSVALNGHELSYFSHLLQCSESYRQSFLNNTHSKEHHIIQLTVNLSEVPYQIIDHLWNHRINSMVAERCELDTAMSWLSSLGGAYSALGDESVQCAQIAGRISLQQFHIALRLGDESTILRCKLYAALSFIQTNKFHQAKCLIKEQYHLATSNTNGDSRLVRMCRGVWAKYRYEHSRYREEKRRRVSQK